MANTTKRKKGKLGGVRAGAGRPPGTKNPETLKREAIAERFRQRTYGIADILFDKQLHLAQGQTFLYKIEKYYEIVGKQKILRKKKPKLVESQWEIEQYLEGKIEQGDEDDFEATYYFITTKEPNLSAIDSLLDRALGSATKSLEVSDPDGALKQIIIIKNDAPKRNNRPAS